MKQDDIALTDLVKQLDFKEHSRLANRVRDILKNKEDWKKYLVKKSPHYGRPEKIYIKQSDKTLVDNLCILCQFNGLFGKAIDNPNEHSPYRVLKKSLSESIVRGEYSKQRSSLIKVLDKTNDALELLDVFFNTLRVHESIDITSQSLSELMRSKGGTKFVGFSTSLSLENHKQLIELQDRLDEGDENVNILLEISEIYWEECEWELLATHLKEVLHTKASEHSGAWAMYALVLQKLLEEAKSHAYSLLGQSDYSGEIEFPLTAEEHWFNESLDSSEDEVRALEAQTAAAQVNTLSQWPKFTNELGAFSSSVFLVNPRRFSLERRQLLRSFLVLIGKSPMLFKAHEEHCKNIIAETFNQQNGYTELMLTPKNSLELNCALRVIEWADKKLHNALLTQIIDNWRGFFRVANIGSAMDFFSTRSIVSVIIEIKGHEDYESLITEIANHQIVETKGIRLSITAQNHLRIAEGHIASFTSKTRAVNYMADDWEASLKAKREDAFAQLLTDTKGLRKEWISLYDSQFIGVDSVCWGYFRLIRKRPLFRILSN